MSATELLDILCLSIGCKLFYPTSNCLVRSDQECLWIFTGIAILTRTWHHRNQLGQFFQTSFDQLFGSGTSFDLSVVPPFRVQPEDRQKKCMFVKAGGELCKNTIGPEDREKALALRQVISVRRPNVNCNDLGLMLNDFARLCKCSSKHRDLIGFTSHDADLKQYEQRTKNRTISGAIGALISGWRGHLVEIYNSLEDDAWIEQDLESGHLPRIGSFSHTNQLHLKDIQEKAMLAYTNIFSRWSPTGFHNEMQDIKSSDKDTPQMEKMAVRYASSMQPDIFKPLTLLERDVGFVYIFRREHRNQSDKMHASVKIGFSRQVGTRMKSIHAKCGFTPSLEHEQKVMNAKRVEALVHAELHIREHRYKVHACGRCNVEHREWFDVGIEEAKRVVEYWSTWMTRHNPYDTHGKLTAEVISNVYAAASRCGLQPNHQRSQAPDTSMQEEEVLPFEEDSTGRVWFNEDGPFSIVTKKDSQDKQADGAITGETLTRSERQELQSNHFEKLSLSVPQSRSRKRVGVELPPAPATDPRCSRYVPPSPLRDAFADNGPSFHHQVTMQHPMQSTPLLHSSLDESSHFGKARMPATPCPAPRSVRSHSAEVERTSASSDDDALHIEQVSGAPMIPTVSSRHIQSQLFPNTRKPTCKSDKRSKFAGRSISGTHSPDTPTPSHTKGDIFQFFGQSTSPPRTTTPFHLSTESRGDTDTFRFSAGAKSSFLFGDPAPTDVRSRTPSPPGSEARDCGNVEGLVCRSGRARRDGRSSVRASSFGKLGVPRAIGHRRVRSIGSVA